MLIGLDLPILDGIGATRLIADHDPAVAIAIVFLAAEPDTRIVDALEAGASASSPQGRHHGAAA